MTKTELAYFAGLIDGERCIAVKRNGTKTFRIRSPVYYIYIEVGMCDPRAIQFFCKAFNTTLRVHQRKNPKWRPCYFTLAVNNKALRIIRLLQPFLITKREEANLAIEYHRRCVASFHYHAPGNNRRVIPKKLLALRHSYYLKLRALKVRKWPIPRLGKYPYGRKESL